MWLLPLLANSIATGCGLWVLIVLFGPISGAHFNPAVTVSAAVAGDFAWSDVAPYVAVQIVAAFMGVAAAHLMFELPLFTASQHVRTGPAQWWSEGVATAGLLLTICLGIRHRPQLVGGLVKPRVHHGGVLVYRLNVFCQSRGGAGAFSDQHFYGH